MKYWFDLKTTLNKFIILYTYITNILKAITPNLLNNYSKQFNVVNINNLTYLQGFPPSKPIDVSANDITTTDAILTFIKPEMIDINDVSSNAFITNYYDKIIIMFFYFKLVFLTKTNNIDLDILLTP